MISSEKIKIAIENGQSSAQKVISFRNQELQKRTQAIKKVSRPPSPIRAFGINTETANLLGPQSQGVLIAEGDSWFDYPFHDVLRILEDHHGYEVESVANQGDRVEEMAYADGQLEEFTRLVEKILRRGTIPRAILLSGGGNDLAGKEFGMLLNHFESPIAGLNDSIVDGVIDERAKMAYIMIISKITSVCIQRIGQPLPIIIHGYDYPVPDGRGPWLEPGFREKGFFHLPDRIDLTKNLIDRFNNMLQSITSLSEFNNVYYIDLRGILSISTNYKDDWANELHPTKDGFEKVTTKFAQTINSLP